MRTKHSRQQRAIGSRPCIEGLEDRRLMSAAVAPPAAVENLGPSWAQADRMWYQGLSGNPAIKYTVPNAPKGMVYNPGGYLAWTPTESQVGRYSLTAVPTNSATAYSFQFEVVVSPDVPSLSYDGTTTGMVGVPMKIQTGDSAPTPGALSILSGPKGVAINSKTGLINWIPTDADAGNDVIVVQSKNPYGQAKLNVPIQIYSAPAVTNIAVKTNGLNAPTMSWTQPTNKGVKVTGYNIILQAYGPAGEKTFAFDRDSAATSFQLHGLPADYYGFIPTVTPLDAAGHKGIAATGTAFKYAAIPPTITVSANNLNVEPLDALYFSIGVGDAATYSLVSAPAGLSFIGYNAYGMGVTWTPTVSQVGTHVVQFSAISQWGTSTVSVPIVVLPPIPDPPSAIWVSNVSSTGVTISWKPPADSAWVVGYAITIQYSNDTSTAFGYPNLTANFNVKSNVFTYHFTTPKLGAFAIRVSSINSQGDGGYNQHWASAGNTIYDPIT